MEFYLVNNQEVQFISENMLPNNPDEIIPLDKSSHEASLSVNIQAKYDKERRNEFSNMLEKSMTRASLFPPTGEPQDAKITQPEIDEGDWRQMAVELLITRSENEATFNFRAYSNPDFDMGRLLADVCGDRGNVMTDIELQLILEEEIMPIRGRDLTLQEMEDGMWVEFMYTTKLNDHFKAWLARKMEGRRRELPLEGRLTMTIKVSPEAVNIIQLDNLNDPLTVNMSLLEENECDRNVVLVAGNGAEINCHSGFLAAHSPVFKIMFESSMTEGNTRRVELNDMSETTVRAIRSYSLCYELIDAIKSPTICMDLLIAADKYDFAQLRNVIREFLLAKEPEWWTASLALVVVELARRGVSDSIDNLQQLKLKGLQVLKSKPKLELFDCPEYQELFKDEMSRKEYILYLIRCFA